MKYDTPSGDKEVDYQIYYEDFVKLFARKIDYQRISSN